LYRYTEDEWGLGPTPVVIPVGVKAALFTGSSPTAVSLEPAAVSLEPVGEALADAMCALASLASSLGGAIQLLNSVDP
jgi:hypothetical protein